MTITFHSKDHNHHVISSLTEFTFPAGEKFIKGTLRDTETPAYLIIRGTDANDYITARLWVEAARAQRPDAKLTAIVPFLPGARTDHDVPSGASAYAELINMINADNVVCYDPHSPVMPGYIERLTVVDSTRIVRQSVVGRADRDSIAQRYDGIIAPDAGAVKRATAVAEACHLPLYQAHKHRNGPSGKLDGFSVDPLPETGKFLVVDDICDAGGTFMGLAEAAGIGKDRLGLYVSHGIFTGQAANLADYFSEIWTTDSIGDNRPDRPEFKIIPLNATLINAVTN
ncbi:ribose-phosphate pyrophosphokinase [Leifsonia sp. Leaf264]|uniref:ribose-phosphate pyrophosphokinase n=1 Tax=Leifsonia sp. Leaf264 TaxID=1736314 RepID=UPI0006FA915C|nr:ribose-phosphate pyrophosphokinase [Leifsonia sp. Leaf264]KQO98157.1 hypothetical protein ASF30_08845 [Leifsonia sp. Leaf264]